MGISEHCSDVSEHCLAKYQCVRAGREVFDGLRSEVLWEHEHVGASAAIESISWAANQDRRAAGRGQRLVAQVSIQNGHRRTNSSVAIQVLMETVLERLQYRTIARHNADIRNVIAIVVSIPNRILIGSRGLPGDLISGRRLLRANRCPDPG